MIIKRNYIAGAWVDGSGTAENINPSDTRDVIGLYARAGQTQATDAIAAAHAALPTWAAFTPQQRADALDMVGSEIAQRKAELAELLAREEGKALADATGEVVRAAQIFKFFAGEAMRVPGELLASTRPGLSVEITREPRRRSMRMPRANSGTNPDLPTTNHRHAKPTLIALFGADEAYRTRPGISHARKGLADAGLNGVTPAVTCPAGYALGAEALVSPSFDRAPGHRKM